jgi:hypothetical protein
MNTDESLVMLDPATDEVLAECSGPTVDGRCPVSDAPPYICAGLHVVGTTGTDGRGVSLTVTTMQPGRCPIAVADGRAPDRR